MEVNGLTNNYQKSYTPARSEQNRESVQNQTTTAAANPDKKSVARLYTEQQKLAQKRVEEILNEGNNIKEAFKKMASHYSAQYLHSGRISQNIKLYKMAQSSYEKAYTWDPTNIDAIKQAAKIRMLV